jgi:hypothetical protein
VALFFLSIPPLEHLPPSIPPLKHLPGKDRATSSTTRADIEQAQADIEQELLNRARNTFFYVNRQELNHRSLHWDTCQADIERGSSPGEQELGNRKRPGLWNYRGRCHIGRGRLLAEVPRQTSMPPLGHFPARSLHTYNLLNRFLQSITRGTWDMSGPFGVLFGLKLFSWESTIRPPQVLMLAVYLCIFGTARRHLADFYRSEHE